MRRFISEEEIKDAIFHPPETTRAYFRGRAVARFHREIAAIQWDEVAFNCPAGQRTVNLNQAFDDGQLERLSALVRDTGSFAEFAAALG